MLKLTKAQGAALALVIGAFAAAIVAIYNAVSSCAR